MSYQNDWETEGCSKSYSSNCVTDIIWEILHAQKEVAGESADNCCSTSCEQSIEDLLSPSTGSRPSSHTTIPFMLTCKDGCSTFFGSGFVNSGSRGHRHFTCVESPVFKVKDFVKGSNNCVRLELLTPVYHRGPRSEEAEDGGNPRTSQHHSSCNSVCSYFGSRPIDNFRYTGVCITVNLDCFCGVSCLDPITPAD